jgi:N-methylhydantoinase A
VPRRLVRDVRVRVDHVALDERSVRQAARELIDDGAQTFAVVLLWSFRNSVHEERVGAIIRELAPDAFVSLSCQVSPIIGEYERTATTALNSYLAPKVAHYLDRIESLPRARGLRGKFNVLNSAGEFVPAREVARHVEACPAHISVDDVGVADLLRQLRRAHHESGSRDWRERTATAVDTR